jgi:hypothetical protein
MKTHTYLAMFYAGLDTKVMLVVLAKLDSKNSRSSIVIELYGFYVFFS